jgi:hypothetical protein
MTTYSPLIGTFTTGDTVTVTIYKLSDNSIIVNAGVCTEIGTTGRFKYTTTIEQTSESYYWYMTNGTTIYDIEGMLEPLLPLWDEPQSNHVTTGTFGDYMGTI